MKGVLRTLSNIAAQPKTTLMGKSHRKPVVADVGFRARLGREDWSARHRSNLARDLPRQWSRSIRCAKSRRRATLTRRLHPDIESQASCFEPRRVMVSNHQLDSLRTKELSVGCKKLVQELTDSSANHVDRPRAHPAVASTSYSSPSASRSAEPAPDSTAPNSTWHCII